jgi:hypothetical protein
LECLSGQGDKLSKDCAEKIAAMRAARRAVHEKIAAECAADAQKICAGVPSGGVDACLRADRHRLSAECRGALK